MFQLKKKQKLFFLCHFLFHTKRSLSASISREAQNNSLSIAVWARVETGGIYCECAANRNRWNTLHSMCCTANCLHVWNTNHLFSHCPPPPLSLGANTFHLLNPLHHHFLNLNPKFCDWLSILVLRKRRTLFLIRLEILTSDGYE